MSMKIKVKRFDKSLPLPEYKTRGSACMDLVAGQDTTIAPRQIGYIPLNVAIEPPVNCWVLLAARSSLHKIGLLPANGIGIGDSDFKGDNDEYKLIVYNFTDSTVSVEKGTRVAQILLVNYEKIEIEETDTLNNSDRGGIGSTGLK